MEEEHTIGSKQMWDSEKGEWVPFDLRGAHFIINARKEYLGLRIYRQFDHSSKGWHSVDSSFMMDKLKENKTDEEKNSPFISFAGSQNFYEMIKQDIQGYKDEGRYSEIDPYQNRYA